MSISAVLTKSPTPGEFVSVGTIPKPKLAGDEILIKAAAFAANPTDWKHIAYQLGPAGSIAGSDVAGTVEAVGADVSGFAKGDKVSAFLRGGVSKERGAFAEYVAVPTTCVIKYTNDFKPALKPGEHAAGPIDTFEGAASVTLGLVTVTLSLAHNLKVEKGTGALLVWLGATATGSLAIQVAKRLYGLTVVTTASPKHTDYLKLLGADAVFDYKDPEVAAKIQEYSKGSIRYALDTISSKETLQSVYDATKGGDVAIDNLLGLSDKDIDTDPQRKALFSSTLAYLAFAKEVNLGVLFKQTPEMVADYKKAWPEVLAIVPQLKHIKLKVLPKGLATAEEALTLLHDNKVSGEKVVWSA